MTLRRKPKRAPGYNSLLLDAWLRDQDSLLDRDDWLRSKGIDPETGKMTLDGLAFFKQLVSEQNDRNRAQRDRRRRRAA